MHSVLCRRLAPAQLAKPRDLVVLACQATSRQPHTTALHQQTVQLPSGLLVQHNSTPAEVMFLYDEVYRQHQYLQHGVQLQPGSIVLDIGANVGIFSMQAAEAVGTCGQVIAVEPAPATAAALCHNLQQHAAWCAARKEQVGCCRVVQAAVSDSNAPKFLPLTIYQRASGWSTLVPDDSEVVGNMQAYVQHLLQSYSPTDEQPAHGGSLKTQPDQPQEAVSQAVRGWSPAQQALVSLAASLHKVPLLQALSRMMGTLYVEQVLLRRSETILVPVTTVSDIITQQQLLRVDLLKVDVERAELQVLQGIQPQHWPLVQQVAMEVHDVDGQLQAVTDILVQQGLTQVVCEQADHLQGTSLVNVFARRVLQPGGQMTMTEGDTRADTCAAVAA